MSSYRNAWQLASVERWGLLNLLGKLSIEEIEVRLSYPKRLLYGAVNPEANDPDGREAREMWSPSDGYSLVLNTVEYGDVRLGWITPGINSGWNARISTTGGSRIIEEAPTRKEAAAFAAWSIGHSGHWTHEWIKAAEAAADRRTYA